MHWVEVAGYPLPVQLGGHAALELCNTWAGWDGPSHPGQEWLRDYDRLPVWANYVGLLPQAATEPLRGAARRRPTEAAVALAEVRRFRADLYRTLTAPGQPGTFEAVAAVVQEAAGAARLRGGDDAGGPARWELPEVLGLRLPLAAAARAAGELLTSPERTAVRACPGDDCGWLFLDPRGRRRWCSMAACGNRAKVRAHTERKRRR